MTESEAYPQFKEDAYPGLPCMRCQYTGKVSITSVNVTTLGDTETQWRPMLCRCSFCGAEYDASLQQAPPPPDNYVPPQNPQPMKR